ncbi:MAG: pyruvate kinase [Bacilli bacterium]|nr:pyruvate kinase [Bacilli bacterium]
MKKTKIVCTIGPVSYSKEVLKQLIKEGMNVARINLSHANHSFCEKTIKNIRELNKELDTNISIMLDLQGPEIRVGQFKNGSASLEKGSIIRIVKGDIIGDKASFSTNYKELYKDIRIGNKILLNDGLIELLVIGFEASDIICRVEAEGIIEDNKGVNIPGVKINTPFITKKDKEDIIFACKMNIDFLALSYVSNSFDTLDVTDLLIELGNDHINIISKIETRSAIEELDEIIKVSDGIMVARGDLGVEIPMEKVPHIQKEIIDKCHIANKVSIIATEMLSSMQSSRRPTRAEVSDVANAVLDSADAVMLSGETTIGDYPVETVSVMSRIIESTEEDINYYELIDKAMRTEKQDITGAISYSVVESADKLRAKAVIASTNSGLTAKRVSRFRPRCPIIAPTPYDDTAKILTLNWGVYAVLVDKYDSTDEIVSKCKEVAKKLLNLEEKDVIIITGGFPAETMHTNFMKIEEI